MAQFLSDKFQSEIHLKKILTRLIHNCKKYRFQVCNLIIYMSRNFNSFQFLKIDIYYLRLFVIYN